MSGGRKQRNWLHEGNKPQNGRKHCGNTTAVKGHYRDTGEISELEEWNLDAKEAIVTLLSEV